jgi:sulfite exporter TauE/SafE
MDFISIFITGLFAGGLTCLAVQGGLLASSVAQRESDKLKDKALSGQVVPIVAFLVSRLFAHTLLGVLLGALGSVAQLSLSTRVILQFLVAVFMIGTAFNLLDVHPVFRYFIIQPPKSLTRLIRSQSRSKAMFGPAILGAMTVFIPCGATQAMMAYAITTGSPLLGALTMFVFILGTSPLFFILGYAAKRLTGSMSVAFNRIAAVIIIIIALYNLSGALALAGYSIPFQTSKQAIPGQKTVSQATIYFTRSGYVSEPSDIAIKAGSRVKLKLVNQDGAGCIQAFTIPNLGLQRIVPVGSTDEVEFTAPQEPGDLAFMCSMGMYKGTVTVM